MSLFQRVSLPTKVCTGFHLPYEVIVAGYIRKVNQRATMIGTTIGGVRNLPLVLNDL